MITEKGVIDKDRFYIPKSLGGFTKPKYPINVIVKNRK